MFSVSLHPGRQALQVGEIPSHIYIIVISYVHIYIYTDIHVYIYIYIYIEIYTCIYPYSCT